MFAAAGGVALFRSRSAMPSSPWEWSLGMGGQPTKKLPHQSSVGQSNQAGAPFFDLGTTSHPNGDTATLHGGDNSGPSTGAILFNDPSSTPMLGVSGHTSDTTDTDAGTVKVVTLSKGTIPDPFTAKVTGSVKGHGSRSFAGEGTDLFPMG